MLTGYPSIMSSYRTDTGPEEANLKWSGQKSNFQIWNYSYMYLGSFVVQSTTSMRSMLLLGGLGACPPRKFWKLHALRLHVRAFSDDKQVHNSSYIHSYIFTSTDAIISSRLALLVWCLVWRHLLILVLIRVRDDTSPAGRCDNLLSYLSVIHVHHIIFIC